MVYMEKVQLLDQGTYTCECRNAAGSSSKEHHLEVHGEHGAPETCGGRWSCWDFSQCKVQLAPKAISWCLGCFGRDAAVWVSFAPWLREMLLIPSTPVPLPTALPRLQGSSSSTLRKVSVIEGGETVLECEAMGTAAPWVTWLKDGQPVAAGDGLLLTEQGRRLHIPRAQVAHAGHYTCLAADPEGQEQREFEVVVHGKDEG